MWIDHSRCMGQPGRGDCERRRLSGRPRLIRHRISSGARFTSSGSDSDAVRLTRRVEQTWNTGNRPQNASLGPIPLTVSTRESESDHNPLPLSLYSSKPLPAIRASETQLSAHYRETDFRRGLEPTGKSGRGAWSLKETCQAKGLRVLLSLPQRLGPCPVAAIAIA